MKTEATIEATNPPQTALDVSGALLSMLCAAHCLLLPLLLAWAPSLGLDWLAKGWVHILLLGLIIPVVALALISGVRHHGKKWILWLGFSGVLILVAALVIGHALHIEGALTLTGSIILTIAHISNFRACRAHCAATPSS